MSFTFVTDWAATMPCVVGAPISRNVAPLTLKWAGCVVHQLDTCLGSCLNLNMFPTDDSEITGAVIDLK
jgi:hypothetical protein